MNSEAELTTALGQGKYAMAVKEADGTYRGVLYDVDASGNFTLRSYELNTDIREPDVVTDTTYGDGKAGVLNGMGPNGENITIEQWKTQLETEYKEVVDRAIANKGFYIARYEASLASNGKVESKQGKTAMTAETNSGDTWYGLYKKTKELNTEVANAKTHMIWGSQWDQMMIYLKNVKNINEPTKLFIKDSTGMGHYDASSAVVTGSNSAYGIKGIYDIAGNLLDWTCEAYGTGSRTIRGGRYHNTGSAVPVSSRGNGFPTSTGSNNGARFVLVM